MSTPLSPLNVGHSNPITASAPLVRQTDDVETEKCAICLENQGNSRIAATFPCTHIYHKWCIDNWLKDLKHADFGCPICKRKIALCLYTEKTPLHVAAARGQSDIVEGLLKQGAHASAITKGGITALHCAAGKGDVATIKCLVKHGADVNALTKGKLGDTPLHLAMLNSHPEAIIALIDSGADINSLAPDKRRPLHFAAAKGYLKVIEILLNKGADINAGSKTPLHFAVEHGQHDAIRLLLGKGANINAQASWLPKLCALEIRICHFLSSIVRMWNRTDQSTVRYGEMEDHLKQFEKTPLHIAIETGQAKTVDLLLTAGAATNVLINRGETLWSWINRVNKLTKPIIKSLASALCRSEASCDDMRAGLLAELIKINEWDLFDRLLTRTPGADINTLHYPGSRKSAFYEVIKEGQKDKIQAMTNRGADVNALYHSGMTPLHCAVFSRHAQDAIEVLVACKADVDAKNSRGQTPLHLAAQSGKSEVIDQLIGHGALVNATSSTVDAAPDVMAKDVGMMTPLHYAAIESRLHAIQHLIDQGASINARTQYGKTPLELAESVLMIAEESAGVDHFFGSLTLSSTPYMSKRAKIKTYTDIVKLLKAQLPSVNLSENL
ncbi:ankyrin repeat domain-containing protein [Salinisphaera sp. G21_0]|uniref:ankyrin repeat domain-containing protein n=1 Tax=Salinisphaera sp. G21_0 TaxID=2821094 RepID=UPI001AD9CB0B|nr:ankyrin repeat domain-containing protein [Salinisphaera sp. G21_0]MBO9483578.1 ankyrin repeat domain-containing protein [Salinisphaera sp. G21_0]